MFVVAGQVPHPVAAAERGLREALGARRAAAPLAREGLQERAASAGARRPGPSGARHPHAPRLPLGTCRCQTKEAAQS